mmetsp:Transcript_16267/g.38156  ORF Transcript_16267/g.38156 Transcript_16267/m.38156 type:complete len:294 (-) Transcript_16267:31-912(-)
MLLPWGVLWGSRGVARRRVAMIVGAIVRRFPQLPGVVPRRGLAVRGVVVVVVVVRGILLLRTFGGRSPLGVEFFELALLPVEILEFVFSTAELHARKVGEVAEQEQQRGHCRVGERKPKAEFEEEEWCEDKNNREKEVRRRRAVRALRHRWKVFRNLVFAEALRDQFPEKPQVLLLERDRVALPILRLLLGGLAPEEGSPRANDGRVAPRRYPLEIPGQIHPCELLLPLGLLVRLVHEGRWHHVHDRSPRPLPPVRVVEMRLCRNCHEQLIDGRRVVHLLERRDQLRTLPRLP